MKPGRLQAVGSTAAVSCPENVATYDVFINHRGPDTKTGFVSYLYEALKARGLQTFLDRKSIDMGEDAWGSIENAIKNSRIGLVVISERYTESPWCLRELDAILGTPEIKVQTIFYNVQPSEVGHPESGPLRDGFEKLEKRYDRAIIAQWKKRLQEASKIMGWEHQCDSTRLEAEFVSDIVAKVLALANKPLPLHVGDYVVGVKEVVEKILDTLQNKKQVWMMGLWGMGGIGKSTLARELYNQMSSSYDQACYIDDVSEMVRRDGVKKIQHQIMMDLLRINTKESTNKFKGKTILKERLSKIQFLLVLDNVQDNDMMEDVISKDMFGAQSMCIVTSRNRKLFETRLSFDDEEEVYIHNVKGLNIGDSEKVFKSLAFRGCSNMKPQIVSNIIKGCGGVPLVLKVIGAMLENHSEEIIWEEVMVKLDEGTIMNEKKIFDCLRISYDALNKEEQEIFLDIACTLIGERKDLAIVVWKSLKWSANLGIQSLIEKALIIVDDKGRLRMHDHLRDMGRVIEKKNVPRIRMWIGDDLLLLHENEGVPNTLQALNLSSSFEGCINELDVSYMKDLRILFCNKSIRIIPSLPRSVIWFRSTSSCNVDKLHFQSKAQENETNFLELFDIGFGNLSNSYEEGNNLKILELYSPYMESSELEFVSLPNTFEVMSNLEVLYLGACSTITMLPNSFGGLKKMRELTLWNVGISCLPHQFGELNNLEVLNLRTCSKLTILPDSFGGLKRMRELTLHNSGIISLPNTIGELTNLEMLDLGGCYKLNILPDSIGGLKKICKLTLWNLGISILPYTFGQLTNLEVLDLGGCQDLTVLPDLFENLKKMRELKLSKLAINSLPQSFGDLSNLEVLDLGGCSGLTMLPDSFRGLKKMRKFILTYSKITDFPHTFGELSNLEVLVLEGCSKLNMLPDLFGGLKKMRELSLCYMKIISLPDTIGELSNLEVLDLSGCSKLTMLPDSFGGLKKMSKLKLCNVKISKFPHTFGEWSNLQVLDLEGCSKLTMLPNLFSTLKKVHELTLSYSGISGLPDTFGELSNLKVLELDACFELSMLPHSFGCLKKMHILTLSKSGINSLPHTFGDLGSLEVLNLGGCSKLTMLPDSFGSLKKMRKLTLSKVGICGLPHTFGDLISLEVLKLDGCSMLNKLPDSFGGLEKMRELTLSNVGIKVLPHTFGKLSNLEVLDLGGCSNLTMLPDSFGGLKKMSKLKLCKSGLNSLPHTFGELSNLRELDLSGCSKLTMLPDSFGSLQEMRKLELSNVGIDSLPRSLLQLSNLEYLNLDGCSMLNILPDSFGGLKMMS